MCLRMRTRLFIVEDELIHAEALKIAIAEAGFEFAGECNNADSAFDEIKRARPDIVLVDIALPGVNNGITLAALINQELKIPHIFVTSFSDMDIIGQAVSTRPAGYLHKPVDWVELKASVQLAVNSGADGKKSSQSNVNHNLVFIKVGDRLVRVNLQEVLVVKADGDNCIALVTEKKEYISRTTLKEFCQQLPAGFIQVHRSYFINLNHLDSFDERTQTAGLKGRYAPVARNFRKDFFESIQKI